MIIAGPGQVWSSTLVTSHMPHMSTHLFALSVRIICLHCLFALSVRISVRIVCWLASFSDDARHADMLWTAPSSVSLTASCLSSQLLTLAIVNSYHGQVTRCASNGCGRTWIRRLKHASQFHFIHTYINKPKKLQRRSSGASLGGGGRVPGPVCLLGPGPFWSQLLVTHSICCC